MPGPTCGQERCYLASERSLFLQVEGGIGQKGSEDGPSEVNRCLMVHREGVRFQTRRGGFRLCEFKDFFMLRS